MQAFKPARRRKTIGLDIIPCKLLKLSSSIVGPSLAFIFKSCIDAEIFSKRVENCQSYTAV